MKKQESKTSNMQMEESGLKNLFKDELKDIYWAEKHLAKALPKMAKGATSEELRTSIEQHLTETENQIARLEQVFEILGVKAAGKKCEAMEGLVEEGKTMLEETETGSMTRDAAIISSAQKIEHYEIASYGTLRTLANTLGLTEAANLLEQTLNEEKNTDVKLTQIAESFVNESAGSEKE
ncbi:YciE/YciF ferroxidase family protein [Pararcticibacter amylolyticus]|uniref:Ferritin-like domain-containing protein n=1 Tax=Pararcticibacter amylolyticus TaxID=2173175 RepID=A0A2U2PFD8_9SPHI|nr:ferritin-like domain-containing protein [Pararcticibacter amylolyticus]PWG80093.1 ferritin-like domain-containing protein [Pararcticibacter amylolyticus]